MAYCTTTAVRQILGGVSVVDHDSLSEASIEANIAKAAAVVDMFIGSRYSTPFVDGSVPAAIQSITAEIAAWYSNLDCLSIGMPAKEEDVVTKRYYEALNLLKSISRGNANLPTDTPTPAYTAIHSSTEGVRKVFDMDHETNWGVDGDELDDIADERYDAESRLPDPSE